MRRVSVVILTTLAVCAAMWSLSPQEPLREVKTIMPKLSDIMYSVQASGRIEQIRAACLYASEYATVERIFVNPGDEIKKGQVIMTLQSSGAAVPTETDVTDFLSETLKKAIGNESYYEYHSDGDMIVSPIDGILTELGVKELETITPLTRCAVVSDISRMQAVVTVPESSISKVTRGMPVGITGDSFDGTFSGVVLEISHQIRSEMTLQGESERYAEVVIELFDTDKRIIPGCSVLAKIYTSKKNNVLTLPYEAIAQDSSNFEVAFVVENGRAVKRYVRTGYELSNLVEIKSGISEGDIVILSPPDDLSDGEKVVIRN